MAVLLPGKNVSKSSKRRKSGDKVEGPRPKVYLGLEKLKYAPEKVYLPLDQLKYARPKVFFPLDQLKYPRSKGQKRHAK
jgi:hypothetical protein